MRVKEGSEEGRRNIDKEKEGMRECKVKGEEGDEVSER